jgi:Leucine-rich repeat (LRR) protein
MLLDLILIGGVPIGPTFFFPIPFLPPLGLLCVSASLSEGLSRLLPDNFGDLNKLILLDLSNNELLNFPQDQIDVFASLLKLNISRNHIDVMPIGFPYLYRLKALEVCCNDLKALPVELDKMKNLEILDISDNIIETLPERICKMPIQQNQFIQVAEIVG